MVDVVARRMYAFFTSLLDLLLRFLARLSSGRRLDGLLMLDIVRCGVDRACLGRFMY